VSKGAQWAAWSVAAVVAIVHFAVAGQYDIFRNELYFIVCGRHPAFGYVDQPPVVPLLAAATQFAGTHVWLLRLPAILAAILIVPLTVSFAQLLGASTRGAWLAAIAIAGATLVTAMSATLSTSTFEPIDFTAVAYLTTYGFLRNAPRAFWWAGIIAGLAFETRYGILFWVIALAVGILLAGPRSIFRSRDLWIGIAIASVIALPNVVWQAINGWPFLELVHNDNSGNFTGTPFYFAFDQILSTNFLLAPLWVAGIIAPFKSARLRDFRFLPIAFVVMAATVLLSHGKSYYLAGAYPTLFALGAAACTRLPRVLIGIWALIASVNAAATLPLVLPVLPPHELKQMIDNMKFRPRPIEAAGIGAPLMQMLSDEFGWRGLARTVVEAYGSLPPSDRMKAAIFASNYGEASAIDVYGKGLPPALSGNNNYYLWGPQNFDGSVVIAVNVDRGEWSSLCNSVRVLAHFGSSPYAMPYETNRPILLCRGMHPPLPQLWPRFKHYGIENLGRGPKGVGPLLAFLLAGKRPIRMRGAQVGN
jgi:Dolichyl-phosphate-mannose-protein mannosyltransferase